MGSTPLSPALFHFIQIKFKFSIAIEVKPRGYILFSPTSSTKCQDVQTRELLQLEGTNGFQSIININ